MLSYSVIVCDFLAAWAQTKCCPRWKTATMSFVVISPHIAAAASFFFLAPSFQPVIEFGCRQRV
jgi:hypothetical protein